MGVCGELWVLCLGWGWRAGREGGGDGDGGGDADGMGWRVGGEGGWMILFMVHDLGFTIINAIASFMVESGL